MNGLKVRCLKPDLATDRENDEFQITNYELKNLLTFVIRNLKFVIDFGWQIRNRTETDVSNNHALYQIKLSANKKMFQMNTPKSKIWLANAAKNSHLRTKDKCVRCEQKVCIFTHSFVLANRSSAFVLGKIVR